MDGEIIKTVSNKAKDPKDKLDFKKGGARYVWNMRYSGFTEFPGMVLYSSPNRGPKAVPGSYKAKFTVGETTSEHTFTILKDPRLKTTQEELQRQFDFLIEVRDEVSKAHDAMNEIRGIRQNLNYLQEQIGEKEEYQELREFSESFDSDMGVIENNIHMTKNQSFQDPLNYGIRLNNRLAFLMQDQQRGDYPPTDQALEVQQVLTEQLGKELGDLKKLFDERIPQLNRMIEEKGIKMIKSQEEEAIN